METQRSPQSGLSRKRSKVTIGAGFISLALVLICLAPTKGNPQKAADLAPLLQSPTQPTVTIQLPPVPVVKFPADSPEAIREIYQFAAAHPEILSYVPCYCMCGRNFGHHSNEDCFVKARAVDGSVVWCAHGAECVLCLTIARRAKSLYLAGDGAVTIRRKIEKEFGSRYKNPTQTPYPPTTR